MTSTVSIIMPVYNSARFLPEAVESVLAQTFADWELVMVDDGSKDGSEVIAARYAAAHPQKVRLLSHPNRENRGVSATRNLALQNSTGRYVAFLDADDAWLGGKLERQVRVLEREGEVGLVFSKAVCIDGNSQRIEQPTGPYQICGEVGCGGSPNEPFDGYAGCVMDTLFAPVPTVMVRRELLERVGGFPLGLKYQCEDVVVWAKIFARSKAFFIPETLARYRVHPGSWSCRQNALSILDIQLEGLSRLIQDEGMNDVLAKGLDRVADAYVTATGQPLTTRIGRARQVFAALKRRYPALSAMRRVAGCAVRRLLKKRKGLS